MWYDDNVIKHRETGAFYVVKSFLCGYNRTQGGIELKKFIILLLIAMLALGPLTACSNNTSDTNNAIKESEEQKSEADAVKVDKGLLSVEITIPKSLLAPDGGEINYDEIINKAKEDGVKDVVINEDGSITYKMDKAQHDKMMTELRKNVKDTFDELINGEDFPSIKEIKSNESFSEIVVVVDRERFENSLDGIGVLGIVFPSMLYQVFDGAKPDNCKVKVSFKDIATNKIYDTVIYPDALEHN